MRNLIRKANQRINKQTGSRYDAQAPVRSLIDRLDRKPLLIYSALLASLVAAVLYISLASGANYQLSLEAQKLVGEPHGLLASSLEYDSESEAFEYNKGYVPDSEVAGQSSQPRFSASFDTDADGSSTVTDAANGTSVTFTPQFDLEEPRQDENRLIYPLGSKNGMKVVSLKTVGFKEDIVIDEYQGDSMEFTYELDLSEGTEARLESDGSIAVYGVNSALLGDVSAASEEDQELLNQARQNAEKQELLFTIPAPFVKELDKASSDVETYFSLEGDELTLHAHGLEDATYPLSIDPSVYVESATRMMRGNAETNIDFDVDSDLIRKGALRGASFDEWHNTLALNQGVWGAGIAATGGYMYSVGGSNGSSALDSVYWARLNPDNDTITSPNPGEGVCSEWCTDAEYDLPEPRKGHSLVAYNGYLYAIGGIDDLGERSSHVYVAKLGANGEPRLWHPTSTDEEEWVYWYRDTSTDLTSERSYHAAVAYENRLYLIGGQTDVNTSGVTTVEFADINPNGTPGGWSSSGMSSLPVGAGRHHGSVEVYNDRMYVIGGVEGSVTTGNIVGNVFYTKLDNGSMNGWTQTTSLSSPRMAWGDSFTAIEGGYLYQAGGCSAVNEADIENEIDEGTYCTEIEPTTQFASINTDGSLASWKSVSGGDAQYIGHNLAAWNGALYRVGGCSAQDEATGDCTATQSGVDYAPINTAGDVSTLSTSSPDGSGTCEGGEPYDCDLPPAGDGASESGQLLAASAVVNSYLYVIGGCTNVDCSNVSGNVSYAEIATDGTLTRPEECEDNYYGAWCVDSTNTVNNPSGVAAAGVATFGDTIYIVGGLDGSSNTNTVFRNQLERDGSLSGSWTSQTLSGGSGIGASDVAHTFVHTRANSTDAETSPGNLYIFGGCTATSGAECIGENYIEDVYKCDIQTDGAVANCDTAGQVPIDTVSGASGPGLGLHAGAVYADYIYLTGGAAPGQAGLDTVRYAQFDDNNDVVAVDGGSWVESAAVLSEETGAGYSFGYNGYLYSAGGFSEASDTVIDTIEFARINVDDGSLEPFSVSSETIDSRWGLSGVVSSSRVYLLGGCAAGAGTDGCSSLESSVRTLQVHNNESGAPESYEPASNLFDIDRIAASSAVHDGYIYIVGGCTDSATCQELTNNVQYAPLDASGNVGGWSNASAALPANRAWGQMEAIGGTLYYIGGQDESANASDDIYYATPSSGDIASWSAASSGLPSERTLHSTAVWNDRIYVTGGHDVAEDVQDSVYVSPQLSTGGDITGSWSTTTGFDVARRGHTSVSYGGNLYVIGGYSGDAYLSDVQVAKINPDGTLEDWSFTASLPRPIQQGDGFAANGYIYLFGGRSSDEEESCQDRTFVAPISANTTADNGNDPTGLGQWFEAHSRFGGERFGIAASYHEGRAYLLGGGCAELLNLADVFSSPGEHTFSSPEDTTQVVVEAWGGGGGGGQGENGGGNAAGGGGGGGGYARHTMPVSPGDYPLMVGDGGSPNNAGGGSWFDTDSTVFADGGTGAGFGDDIGFGGSANIGSDATFIGGDGGTGWQTAQPFNRRGGGGGGSAFNDADGGDGEDGTNSAGSGSGGIGEGDGGDGSVDEGNGQPGNQPGAGGGGGGYQGQGGPGATGMVIVHYQEWSELVLTGSNRVSVGTLLAQPQVANYSYTVDADSDVHPYGWLMNGEHNSTDSNWQLQYASSMSQAAGWGQETAFDAVALGQPEAFIPLDESGSDTNFARYYSFSISIDHTQSYGFPDDVQRSPVVSDISLYFTADPNKRLRHGQTFIEGGLHPYNTPF